MTIKNGAVITSAIVAFLLMALMAPVAFAKCDITGLDCKGEGKKCNIKFKNLTGEGSGAGGGTGYKQVTLAANLKVTARAGDGSMQGNIFEITAGASKTVNLDNKKFSQIKIHRETGRGMMTGNETTYLTCDHITSILNGNGSCKVFVGQTHGRKHTVAKCDGGNVIVPLAHTK